MNNPQGSTLDAARHPESTPEVFALTPCVIDSVSVSGGLLCLVMPNGETARVPVEPEKVAEVARALMARPTVLLLAREGVVLPQALPAQAEGGVDKRHELVALKQAVFAAAEGRSFDPDGVDPEHRDVVRALQRMSNAVVAQAKAPAVLFDPAAQIETMRQTWARETASLSEERNGLRRAMQMLDEVVRLDDGNLDVTDADEPTVDEVPDTMAREIVAMVRALVRRKTCGAGAVPFDPAVHVTRAEVVDALKVTHDCCKYLDDQRKVAALVARFSTVTSEVPA